MFEWWRERRRQEILSQPFPQSWRAIMDRNVALVARLSERKRTRLEDLVQVFLAEKDLEGCGGLELTDEIRVTVATSACILLLGLDHDLYRSVQSVLIYPSTVRPPERPLGAFEVRTQVSPVHPLLGEAHLGGPVIVVWDAAKRNCRHPENGHNVVFHEFAHKLDMLDGRVDGTPPLRGSAELARWAQVCSAAYLELKQRTNHGQRSFMDGYGAHSEAEFFAVATEAFFDQPAHLQHDQPALYEVLRDFYKQDPLRWGTPDARELPPRSPSRSRLVPLDWMRGLVMVLMSIDHASDAFNAGRLFSDSARTAHQGLPLPAAQFLTRWMTHLCAPTFVFLAGTAIALSVEHRLAREESSRSVDRYLLQRGLLIAALDPLWMTWGFTWGRIWLLQVLYAIGTSLMLMALLRRLSITWLVGISLGLMVGAEALIGVLGTTYGSHTPLLVGMLLSGMHRGSFVVAYPTIPWLAIMMLGWACGRFLVAAKPQAPHRLFFGTGALALVTFAAVRGANAYGNMALMREGYSLVQWLHVSKYPPSLSYYTLELGLMFLALGAFFSLDKHGIEFFGQKLLRVLGQTALFYYLLHVHLLELAAHALRVQGKLGLSAAYIGGALIVLVLYPACLRYRAYKQLHPEGWTRYL